MKALIKKLYKFGTGVLAKKDFVHSVMITGKYLNRMNTVVKITGIITESAGQDYPVVEALINEPTFFLSILKPRKQP